MSDERIDQDTPTATLQIYQFIDTYLGRKEKDTRVNRASSASLCYKRRWYQAQGFEGEALTARKIVNFTLGDLTEHTVKYFIAKGCVGAGKLYSEVDFGTEVGRFTIQQGKEIVLYDQPDLTADIGGITVSAHVDGWGRRNSDGMWELIEVKSAADYGFEDFKNNGPGDYLKQAMVNLQTNRGLELGADGVRFFYLKKNTGHLWDSFRNFDKDLAKDVAEEYKLSNQKEEPKAPHMLVEQHFRGKPTGLTVAAFPCTYCPYLRECKGEHTVEIKSGRPTYIFKRKEG